MCELKQALIDNFKGFIQETEKEFGIKPAELSSMTSKELNAYIDFCDYLWEK